MHVATNLTELAENLVDVPEVDCGCCLSLVPPSVAERLGLLHYIFTPGALHTDELAMAVGHWMDKADDDARQRFLSLVS